MMALRGRVATGVVLFLLVGCATPRMPEAYRRGARLERQGDDLGALAAFQKAADTCQGPPADCDLCRLRLGETYARLGRHPEALRAWAELQRVSQNPATAARALDLRAALYLERLDRPDRAQVLSIQVILRYPDETAATDALRRICRLHRRAGKEAALVKLLQRLHRRVPNRAISANLLMVAARSYRARGQGDQAVTLFDRVAAAGQKDPLWDDALFEAGQLLERLDRPQQALERYQKLLASRKPALLMGSYNSVHLDDAQLRAADLLAHKLDRPDRAVEALDRFADHFPTSRMRDEALLMAATLRAENNAIPRACATLDRLLNDFPDGTAAPAARALRRKLSCTHP